MQVQEWLQLNLCLQEKFVQYSINWTLQNRNIDERKNTNGKHYNPSKKNMFQEF